MIRLFEEGQQQNVLVAVEASVQIDAENYGQREQHDLSSSCPFVKLGEGGRHSNQCVCHE